jgi:zinc transport system substrate-binding protein
MRKLVIATLALFVPLVPFAQAAKSETAVVASILPVHSLVAGVMEGVGKPYLLVPGGASPHSFALRPSNARKLDSAQAVFWIGPTMETFLVRPLKALTQGAVVVSLADAKGVTRLAFREGGPWAEHDHDHEAEHRDEKDHDHEHGHAKEADHAEKAEHGHDHDHHDREHGHADHNSDAHLWLDPENAVAFVAAIAEAMAQADPENKGIYAANAGRLTKKLRALDAELRQTLAPAKGKPYIVFHDAYQYFEAHYGLTPAGSVTVSPELSPGAKHLVEIRDRIRTEKAVCVFAEPQFEPKLIRTVVQGTGARTATLDPLGARLKPGPGAYFTLMRNLAKDLTACLDGRS